MTRCIIVDSMHQSIISGLQALDIKVDYRPDITRAELLQVIDTYQGLIIRSNTPVDKELIAKAKSLRFVARAGAGIDNFDQPELDQAGIKILKAAEANKDALAEHVLGMILTLLHKLHWADSSVRKGAWEREAHRGVELTGQTVGLVGYGNMGSAVAQCLKGFGCTVLAYDKYKTQLDPSLVQSVAMPELFRCCNILSLHVPLTAETRGFYDYSFFQQFQHPLLVVNTARGEILPLGDLVRCLEEGKVSAAALDVFECEPLSQLSDKQIDAYNYLLESPKVLLSPHVAGWSQQSYEKISKTLTSKIAALQVQGIID